MAARYTKSNTKCNNLGSGRRCKTKIYFTPFKVEINFSLQFVKYSQEILRNLLKKTKERSIILSYDE